MAQLVKRPTLDFGSGHDLMVHGFKPCLSPVLSVQSLLGVLSLSLSLSLPQNKRKNNKRKKTIQLFQHNLLKRLSFLC